MRMERGYSGEANGGYEKVFLYRAAPSHSLELKRSRPCRSAQVSKAAVSRLGSSLFAKFATMIARSGVGDSR
jgi:hypothetical protein